MLEPSENMNDKDTTYTGKPVPIYVLEVEGKRLYRCKHVYKQNIKGIPTENICDYQQQQSQGFNISSLFGHAQTHWRPIQNLSTEVRYL